MLLALTALGKTVLLLVAITFILFAFVTAIMIPGKRPDFPRNLSAYLVAAALLFAAQMGAVVWVTGTQEVEHEEAGEATGGEETEPAETGGQETTPTETAPAGGDAEAGKAVFASAGCGGCHTLADAGASGAVGPNLDEAKPPAALVVDRVTNGKGVMPSFKEQLSAKQISDVAAYVSSVAGT